MECVLDKMDQFKLSTAGIYAKEEKLALSAIGMSALFQKATKISEEVSEHDLMRSSQL